MTFTGKILAGTAAVLLAAFAALFLLRGGEEKRIRAVIDEGSAAALRGDAETCIALLAKDYSHGGLTRDSVADQLRTYIKPGRWEAVEILAVDPATEGDSGQAKVRLLLQQSGVRIPLSLMLFFRKGDGRWRISGYDVLER